MTKMYECRRSHTCSVCAGLSCGIIFYATCWQDGVELWHLKVFYPSWINRLTHTQSHTHMLSHAGWLWHRQTHILTRTRHQTSPNMCIPHTWMGSPPFSSLVAEGSCSSSPAVQFSYTLYVLQRSADITLSNSASYSLLEQPSIPSLMLLDWGENFYCLH